jgi:hypothetical protein
MRDFPDWQHNPEIDDCHCRGMTPACHRHTRKGSWPSRQRKEMKPNLWSAFICHSWHAMSPSENHLKVRWVSHWPHLPSIAWFSTLLWGILRQCYYIGQPLLTSKLIKITRHTSCSSYCWSWIHGIEHLRPHPSPFTWLISSRFVMSRRSPTAA